LRAIKLTTIITSNQEPTNERRTTHLFNPKSKPSFSRPPIQLATRMEHSYDIQLTREDSMVSSTIKHQNAALERDNVLAGLAVEDHDERNRFGSSFLK